MEKFIPYEKLSKKKKRELDAGKRAVWAISPVTRKSENPKAYNRRKAQKRMDDPGSVLSFFEAIERWGDSWIIPARLFSQSRASPRPGSVV